MLLMLLLMPLVTGDTCTIRQIKERFSNVVELKCNFCTRQSTDPGAISSHLPCVFPFTYLGTQHDACTVAGHPEGLAWCSTRTEGGRHVEGGGHWGLCDSSCPQETTCPKGWTHLPTGCYLLDTQVINNTLQPLPSRCAQWRKPVTSAWRGEPPSLTSHPWSSHREVLI